MTRLDWERLWAPEGKPVELDQTGLLPEGFLASQNPDLAPFRALASSRCLLLLGEPGAGKSDALEEAARLTQTELAAADDIVLPIDLASVDRRELRQALASPDLDTCRGGERTLHLYLDSLDEAKIHISHLGKVLQEEIRKFRPERLWLRIACRSAERVPSLQSFLSGFFGADDYRVFHLAELGASHVRTAAKERGLDPDRVLREILDRDAGGSPASR